MKTLVLLAATLAQCVLSQLAHAEPSKVSRAAAPSAFMRVYGSAAPPFGFVQFCDRMPSECAAQGVNGVRFDAGPNRLSELDHVNRRVNAEIAPATDLELYGVVEYWTLPNTSGDCEDYALLKRQILMNRGWPASALLMTVVRDDQGDGHAILTVRTAQGDFILDNKVSDIKLWHQTGYKFVMRQSYVDPRLWMSLATDAHDRGAPATSQPARR